MVHAEKLFYVAPTNRGNGSGTSASNAVQYRNPTLWQIVNSTLRNEAVTVRFVDGVYSDDTLTLSEIGDADHRLTLTGATSQGAVFNSDFNWNIRLRGSRNITFRDLHFTGDVNSFALHMQDQGSTPTRDVLVDNCTFIDMPEAQYGAIGITFQTHDVTIQNSTFQRVGKSGGAHMIYTDHGPSNIFVYNNLFEDDPGDYVRFRDDVGYFEVVGNTFRSTAASLQLSRPFLSMPLFNDVNPGDEVFATEMLVRNNRFEYHSVPNADPYAQWYGHAISFANFGYNYPGYTYQLTPSQARSIGGETSLGVEDRIALLKTLTGVDLYKVSIADNAFVNVPIETAYGSWNQYGAPSSGWIGFLDIADLVQHVNPPGPPGDFDGDGAVDGNDFLTWQRNPFLGDLARWKSTFGATTEASGQGNSVGVPEPATLTLFMLGALSYARTRWFGLRRSRPTRNALPQATSVVAMAPHQ